MPDIQATYEVSEPGENKPTPKIGTVQLALTMAGIIAALTVSVLALLHVSTVSTPQAAQIRSLQSSSTRLAGQVAAERAEIAGLRSELAGLGARLTSADPASDPSLITCGDLRRMDLRQTTGGSVPAVPGPVDLDQAAVALPAHCARK
jgi:hypothetical protein